MCILKNWVVISASCVIYTLVFVLTNFSSIISTSFIQLLQNLRQLLSYTFNINIKEAINIIRLNDMIVDTQQLNCSIKPSDTLPSPNFTSPKILLDNQNK